MNEYGLIGSKKPRKGYTTGACAAAAAKAAAKMLLTKKRIDSVTIDTPAGISLTLPLCDQELRDGSAMCSVVKDGGDDPDVTAGLKIFAKAVRKEGEGIEVTAGEGIGIVTMPGLKVPVGKPAINPVPMRMILKEAGSVLPEGAGICLHLWVPGGEEAAKKTYNLRLGIIGGISILGTTGIVHPMSEDAWRESLALELKVLAASGAKYAILVFGNYGTDFAANTLRIDASRIVKMSNFVGFMLKQAAVCGFERLLLAGHLGKLVKVAAGIFNTHSAVADARMEILAAYAALEGAGAAKVSEIYRCRTTDGASALIDEAGLNGVYRRIVENAACRCMTYVDNSLFIGCALFDQNNHLLAVDENGVQILREAGAVGI